MTEAHSMYVWKQCNGTHKAIKKGGKKVIRGDELDQSTLYAYMEIAQWKTPCTIKKETKKIHDKKEKKNQENDYFGPDLFSIRPPPNYP
jgi:hypothetical protein